MESRTQYPSNLTNRQWQLIRQLLPPRCRRGRRPLGRRVIIGAIHLLAKRLGLDQTIDGSLGLLKVHLPYHESDHALNIDYNLLAGGRCLEHLELLRSDEPYLNALGARRIPDPATAVVSLFPIYKPGLDPPTPGVNIFRLFRSTLPMGQ